MDNDHEYLVETWIHVPDLIYAGVISREDAAAHKEGFLELLESDDEEVKESARDDVHYLIEDGVISKEDLPPPPRIVDQKSRP